ncbi:MAG: hypothetical protein BalsKO_00420 [Balneolaceae bacterium]
MKYLVKKLLYLVYLFSICFILLESIFQLYIYFSGDTRGFYSFFEIQPDEKYWNDLTSSIDNSNYIILDENLGWTIKKNGVFRDSLYVSNSAGIRSNKEFELKKDSTFRIGLFGDSFIHSDDVYFEESLAYHLESNLVEKGFEVEVLNFGVSGYDMTQAYLRYKNLGENYDLDIVLFGFQIENFWRNLNVYRPNYYLYTGFPFVKPKLYHQNDSLKYIDISGIDLEYIKKLPLNFETSRLSQYEYFTDTKLMSRNHFLSWSYVNKIVVALLSEPTSIRNLKIEDNAEGLMIMNRILGDFKSHTKENATEFLIVQLPNNELNDYYIEHRAHPNPTIINSISDQYLFIRTDSLLAQYPIEKTYNYHYTSFGNKIISNQIVSALVDKKLITRN